MKNTCLPSGELDSGNFAKPMPVIGLYVAGASLACLLLMALDIIISFRDKMYWIKCKFFKLNSVTITLLSIATKLPTDLNTSMPGAQHQFAKVTGIVMLCVSMGFFTPSLCAMSANEMWPNMAALAILVATVAIDVGIQIGTGAIFAFIPEHILLLCVMLLLLEMMALAIWLSIADAKFIASSSEGALKSDIFNSSLDKYATDPQARLDEYCKSILPKVWKVLSATNVQRVIVGDVNLFVVGILSVTSAVILFEIGVRYLLLPFLHLDEARRDHSNIFCMGKSDYGWSIGLVWISQCLVVLLASIAIFIRLLHNFDMISRDFYDSYEPRNLFKRMNDGNEVGMPPQFSNLLHDSDNVSFMELLTLIAQLAVMLFILATGIIPITIFVIVYVFLLTCRQRICTCKSQTRTEESINQILELSSSDNSIKDMVAAWLQKGRRWRTTHLLQLLTDHHDVIESIDWSSDPIWCLFDNHIHKFQGSCYFFLTALIHITISLSSSSNSNESELIKLVGAVKEAERALLFMDKCILPTSNTLKAGTKAGQLMWDSMKNNWPVEAAKGSSVAAEPKRVFEKMKNTAANVHTKLLRHGSSTSATSVMEGHVERVCKVIRDTIRTNSSNGAPDQVLQWLSKRILYIIVYCLFVILYDEKCILKMQVEHMSEAAQLLGMIQGLEQKLFPMLQQNHATLSSLLTNRQQDPELMFSTPDASWRDSPSLAQAPLLLSVS